MLERTERKWGRLPFQSSTVPIKIGDLAGRRFVDVEALVDTGVTYTLVSNELLDRLGIEPESRRTFELADESVVDYPIGYVRV